MQKLYIVTYDLRRPEQNYPQLIAALKRIGAQRFHLSEWVLAHSSDAATIGRYLQQFTDANDRLFVGQLDPDNWISWNEMVDPNELTAA